LQSPINAEAKPHLVAAKLPRIYSGYTDDLEESLLRLDLPVRSRTRADWAVPRMIYGDSLELNRRRISRGKVPDVRGMGLRDAMYLLGNEGLQVKAKGIGRVTTQSIKPGTATRGQTIFLDLKL